MENRNPVEPSGVASNLEASKPVSQGLLDALESLGAALSVVSISVDMVREELQSVLAVLSNVPQSGAVREEAATENSALQNSAQSQLFPFPNSMPIEAQPEIVEPPKIAPAIYLVERSEVERSETESKRVYEDDALCHGRESTLAVV